MDRITPKKIEDLEKNQVFVFGSNESGIHGAGAANLAYKKFGATLGQGFGMSARTFAIPTKDWNIGVLPISAIRFYVDRFIAFVKDREMTGDWEFLVTEVGCGLAGYQPEQIAPLFKPLQDTENVWLPQVFRDIYECMDMTEEKFEKVLEEHDWYYKMSEDERVHNEGLVSENRIMQMIRFNHKLYTMYKKKGDEMFSQP